jgi:SAM-dependent methyltransferase
MDSNITRDAAFFSAAYEGGVPPWDIGRPQPEFVRLAEAGEIQGRILDAGCGTGELTLLLASQGRDVLGVDAAPVAIERATAKAEERHIDAAFLVTDALALDQLGRSFDTVVDCALFHIFSDADRARYVACLESVLRPGGTLHLLCFSDRVPPGQGPRRISQDDIRTAFAGGWTVNAIRDARIEINVGPAAVPAWLATITRNGAPPA